MLGRGIMAIFWGVMADRYGRKPILIIGTSTMLVTIPLLVIRPCFKFMDLNYRLLISIAYFTGVQLLYMVKVINIF